MGNAASATQAAAPKAQLRVVGLGDPVTDILLSVDSAALQYLGAEPGSCVQVRGSMLLRQRQFCPTQHLTASLYALLWRAADTRQ